MSSTYSSVVLGDNPIAYYRLNESSGTVATDQTANHYNATLTGTITYGQSGAIANDSNTALGFDANGGITLPAALDPGSFTAYSVEYWIKITSGWQHVVFTTDNSTGTTSTYLNGVAYGSGAGDVVLTGQAFTFSGSPSAAQLDELAIYNFALSATQIQNHYLTGISTATPLTLYTTDTNSARLTPNGELLVDVAGGAQGSTTNTNFGAHINWGEIGFGFGNNWAGATSTQAPDGTGAFYDATTLEAKQLVGGYHTPTVTLDVSQSGKQVVGDLLLRYYKYNTSTKVYTLIGTITRANTTITSTATAFTFPMTNFAATNFNTNESLYIDLWINIASNTMTSGGLIRNYTSNSTTLGWSGSQFVTPGYGPQVTTIIFTFTDTVSSADTLFAVENVLDTNIFVCSDGIASETALPDSVTATETGFFALLALPVERVTSTEASSYALSYNDGDSIVSIDTINATNPILLPDVALAPSETFTRVFAWNPVDTPTLVDATTFTQARSFSESTTLSDGIASETALPDKLTTSDNFSGAVSVFSTDAFIETSSYAEVYFVNLSETLVLTDTINFISISIGQHDLVDVSVVPSDTLAFQYSYSYIESVVPSDTITSVSQFTQYPYLGWDTFTHPNNASTWPNSTDGQTWAVTTGNGALSITGNEGVVTSPSALTFIRLGSKTATNQSAIVRFAVHSTSVTAAGLALRLTASNTTYRFRVNSQTSSQGIGIVRTVAGTSTNIVTASFTPTLNTFYWMRAQVVNTSLFVKVWQDGTVEPNTWTLTTTDSNITGAGGFGLVANSGLAGDTITFDNFFVVDYALGDYSVFPLDLLITQKALGITETQTSVDTSKTATSVTFVADTLSISETFLPTKILNNTYLLNNTETTLYTLSSSLIEIAPTLSDFVSTIARSTVSDIEGIDAVTSFDTLTLALSFAQQEATPPTDTFVYTYTYNDPYAGTARIASDTYVRANQSGWGTASDGNVWAVASGTLTYGISSNQGTISGTSGAGFTFLGSASTLDGEAQITFKIKDNTNDNLGLALRVTDANNLYYAYYANNTIFIKKIVSGTTTTVTSAAFTGGTSNFYHLKFAVAGSVLTAKMWQDGAAESATWISGTDTAITTAGKTGVYAASTTAGTILVYNYLVIDYRLSDLTSLIDATQFTGISLATEAQTYTDIFTEAISYSDGDNPIEVEIGNFLQSFLWVEYTVTSSDTAIPTVQARGLDALTSSSLFATALNSLLTDVGTLFDASSLFLYVPIDLLTSVEALLAGLQATGLSTDTLSEAISPTLIRPLTETLTENEQYTTTVIQGVNPDAPDILAMSEQMFSVVNQLQTTIFNEVETLFSAFALTFAIDANTLVDRSTTTGNIASPTVTLNEIEHVLYTLVHTQTLTQTVLEFLLSELFYAQIYKIPFVVDVSFTAVNQLETTIFNEQDVAAYNLSLHDNLFTPLVDASTTTRTQFQTDSLLFGASIQRYSLRFVPVEQLTFIEQLQLALVRLFKEHYFLIEEYRTTVNALETGILTVGAELLAEILKFGPIEALTASEIFRLAISTPFTDSVLLGDLARYILVQKESTTFAEQEQVVYALAFTKSDPSTLAERYTLALSFALLYQLNFTESAGYTIRQLERDLLQTTETLRNAFSVSYTDNLINVEKSFYSISESLYEITVNVLDTLTSALATTFTGWVDILAMRDVSATTGQYHPIENSSVIERLASRENPLFIDPVSAQEILMLSSEFREVDTATAQDRLFSSFFYTRSENLTLTELPTWQGVQKALDSLLPSDAFTLLLSLVPVEIFTLIERFQVTERPFFAETLTLAPSVQAYALSFVPQELLQLREVLLALLVRTLVDTALVPVELAPSIGQALLDAALQISEFLNFSHYIFMNVIAILRSGETDGVIRSGDNDATIRSGQTKGVVQ